MSNSISGAIRPHFHHKSKKSWNATTPDYTSTSTRTHCCNNNNNNNNNNNDDDDDNNNNNNTAVSILGDTITAACSSWAVQKNIPTNT